MMTFDEAIDDVFVAVHITDTREILEEKTRYAAEMQMGYSGEAMANDKLIKSLCIVQSKMAVDLIATDCDDVLGLNKVILETLITVFLWGLATGRKMNEQDL